MKMPSLSSCMKSSPPAKVKHRCQQHKDTHGVHFESCASLCVCVFALTTQVLQDEIELPSRLEGIDEIHDEGMLHLLQDVPLCLGVGRVLGVADNHRLAESDETELRRGCAHKVEAQRQDG